MKFIEMLIHALGGKTAKECEEAVRSAAEQDSKTISALLDKNEELRQKKNELENTVLELKQERDELHNDNYYMNAKFSAINERIRCVNVPYEEMSDLFGLLTALADYVEYYDDEGSPHARISVLQP